MEKHDCPLNLFSFHAIIQHFHLCACLSFCFITVAASRVLLFHARPQKGDSHFNAIFFHHHLPIISFQVPIKMPTDWGTRFCQSMKGFHLEFSWNWMLNVGKWHRVLLCKRLKLAYCRAPCSTKGPPTKPPCVNIDLYTKLTSVALFAQYCPPKKNTSIFSRLVDCLFIGDAPCLTQGTLCNATSGACLQ